MDWKTGEIERISATIAGRPYMPGKMSAMEELEGLLGVERAKEAVKNNIAYCKMVLKAAEKGRQLDPLPLNMVFMGNPGTAKTTVARLVARAFFEEKIIRKNVFLEVGRSDLVGEYSGHTAVKTKNIIDRALSGVLFIDEAYSLCNGENDSFGLEAINMLTQEIDNQRDNLCVILAGYSDKMEEFLKTNPGLKSRFQNYIMFDDYSADELLKISGILASKNGFRIHPDAEEKLTEIFRAAIATGTDFGAGRFARNLIDKAKQSRARSLSSLNSYSDDEMFTLMPGDFPDIESLGIPCTDSGRKIGF